MMPLHQESCHQRRVDASSTSTSTTTGTARSISNPTTSTCTSRPHWDDDDEQPTTQRRRSSLIEGGVRVPTYRITPIHIIAVFITVVGVILLSNCLSSSSSTSSLLQIQQLRKGDTEQKYRNQFQAIPAQTPHVLYTDPHDIPLPIVQDLDVILVLGGGRPITPDQPPIFVQQRCEDALAVIERRRRRRRRPRVDETSRSNHNTTINNSNVLPILCLSAGTAHLPQLLSPDGLPIWESTACAAYLLHHNHNQDDEYPIYVETTSYDTIGNAFYARTGHTDLNQWYNVLIITNEFHMERVQKIFNWIYALDLNNNEKDTTNINTKYNNPNHNPNENKYQLSYLQSPNIGLSDEAIRVRKEREQQSSNHVDALANTKTTLLDVYTFLTTEHALYTATKLVERSSNNNNGNDNTNHNNTGEGMDDTVKISYGLK